MVHCVAYMIAQPSQQQRSELSSSSAYRHFAAYAYERGLHWNTFIVPTNDTAARLKQTILV